MSLDFLLWLTGVGAEAVIVSVLVSKRAYKLFPIFTACVAWGLLSDLGYHFASPHLNRTDYFLVYLTGLTIDSLLEFGVLVELAWSILRPLQSALPRGAIVIIAFVIGGICAAIWPFAVTSAFSHYGPQSRLLIHLQQTFSIMRVLIFLILAACSQLLSISWRDRELQIATGLGFYSLVSVVTSIIEAGQASGPLYHHLDQIAAASYLCSLLYWAFSFATKEAPRREFTPQMEGFLLAMAGAARSTRVSLTEARRRNERKADD